MFEVALVVVLRRPEDGSFVDFSDDGAVEGFCSGEFGDKRFSFVFLSRAVPENGRAILRAGVVSLTVQGRRVVQREEDFEQFAVTDFVGVKMELYNFGVAGLAGADLLVGGVFNCAAHIAGDGGFNAFKAVIGRFQAPETAAGEGRDVLIHVVLLEIERL